MSKIGVYFVYAQPGDAEPREVRGVYTYAAAALNIETAQKTGRLVDFGFYDAAGQEAAR